MQQPTDAASAAEGMINETTSALDLVMDKLGTWYLELVKLLPNLVVAVVVLLIFWLLAKLVRRIVRRIVERVSENAPVAGLLSSLAFIAVIAIGLFISLGLLELDKTVTSLLAGAGVIGLALAFAFQDLAANFVSGVMISIRKPYKLGDLIETNDHVGKVDQVDLRNTVLHTPDGKLVMVPNKAVFENVIVNHTSTGRRRVDLPVGVSYADDLEKAKELAIRAVEGVESRIADTKIEFFYEAFGGSSIDFIIRFWIPFASSEADYKAAMSDAIVRIKKAFDEGGITIPFPIRTLDFGIEGGVTLAEAARPLVDKS
ncbi:MAG: mechanosensitive ion channel family protein [Acidobacteriota bacterium]